ncbi:MAG: hypothetical protein SFV81_26300 [Pirellulaceae bacterium]|nr:hypothetical protein [Pirellulaceae bacterium]
MTKRSNDDDSVLVPVELLIRAAGNYVVPSDNLRPRTLEAARESVADRAGFFRLARLFLVLLFCSAVSIPALDRLAAWHDKSVSPSGAEIQNQANEFATEKGVGPHWGLYEAFKRLRNHQAENLSPKR